jgi:hypothetical protein
VAKFSVYEGKFVCHKCKSDVPKARFWRDTYDFTWMCSCKYVSKVNLYGKGY